MNNTYGLNEASELSLFELKSLINFYESDLTKSREVLNVIQSSFISRQHMMIKRNSFKSLSDDCLIAEILYKNILASCLISFFTFLFFINTNTFSHSLFISLCVFVFGVLMEVLVLRNSRTIKKLHRTILIQELRLEKLKYKEGDLREKNIKNFFNDPKNQEAN